MRTILLALLVATGLTAARPTSMPVEARRGGEAADSVRHPAWSRSAMIHELNVRQFMLEGTLVARSITCRA